MDIFDNVVPYIGGEEGKMESESKKIFGKCVDGQFVDADFQVRVLDERHSNQRCESSVEDRDGNTFDSTQQMQNFS